MVKSVWNEQIQDGVISIDLFLNPHWEFSKAYIVLF